MCLHKSQAAVTFVSQPAAPCGHSVRTLAIAVHLCGVALKLGPSAAAPAGRGTPPRSIVTTPYPTHPSPAAHVQHCRRRSAARRLRHQLRAQHAALSGRHAYVLRQRQSTEGGLGMLQAMHVLEHCDATHAGQVCPADVKHDCKVCCGCIKTQVAHPRQRRALQRRPSWPRARACCRAGAPTSPPQSPRSSRPRCW